MDTHSGKMLAAAIESYGDPDTLRLREMPMPVPAADEVLIRVAAVGVNPADAKWRAGMFAQWVPVSFPYIPGYDVAGTIEDGTAFARGTRVVAMLDNRKAGAYAQFAVVACELVARIPEGLADDTAAALPTPALTGVQIVEQHVVPDDGDRVLITGATGAVGRSALYAAKARGAYVIAAVRISQQALAVELGADETLVLGGAVAAGTAPFDHVVDTVGGSDVAELCKHVRRGGKIKTVATTPIPATGLASSPEFIAVRGNSRQLERILAAVAAGDIRVPIATRLPLAHAAEAHRLLEAGGLSGKIILRTP